MNTMIMVVSATIALIAVLFNIGVVYKNPYVTLKWLVIFLLSFTALRYVTLIVYSDAPSGQTLQRLRYFYFASSIGITLPTALAVWYVTPSYREKITPLKYTAFFTPWILFYLYVIVKQPTMIVKGSQFGYELMLTGKFPFYLGVVQGSFVTIMIILCLIGIIKFKHLQIRVQLGLIIIAQLLLAVDGFSYSLPGKTIFPPFTITEALALGATYYAYSKSVKMIKSH